MGIIERKEREREARKNQILEAAQKVFEDRGVGTATMDEIAKSAELAKGTIYLYYKNKEELLLGLILRGFEVLTEMIVAETNKQDRGLNKLMVIGDAYRLFAMQEKFLFGIMNVSEPPAKSNISQELIDELGVLSGNIWTKFIEVAEQAKAEGDVKPEVNGFTFVMTMWLSGTGVLRMYNKCMLSKNSVFAARSGGIHLELLDWNYIYNLTERMLLENVVTEQGRVHLEKIEWRSFEQLGLEFSNKTGSFTNNPMIEEEAILS